MQNTISTDLNEFFEELGEGVLKPMLEQLVSQVTMETMTHGDKRAKGSIQLNFQFVPLIEQCQIVLSHKLTYKCPTLAGSRGEEMRGSAVFFVAKGGRLTSQKPEQDLHGQLDMFGR